MQKIAPKLRIIIKFDCKAPHDFGLQSGSTASQNADVVPNILPYNIFISLYEMLIQTIHYTTKTNKNNL